MEPIETQDEDATRWDPPGAKNFYRMEAKLSPDFTIEGSVTVRDAETDFSTLVLKRIGGPNEADWAFRRELYYYIGMATVSGGKIEASLKRVLKLLSEPKVFKFAEVEKMLSTLETMTAKAARVAIDTRPSTETKPPVGYQDFPEAVLQALSWSKENDLVATRNHIVHSSWWDFADTGVTRSRFYLNGTSALQYAHNFDRMRSDCAKLDAYANRLQELVGDRWFTLHLPRARSTPVKPEG